MSSVVIDGIGQLVTNDVTHEHGLLGVIDDAALVIEHGKVAWAGPSSHLPSGTTGERFDAHGRTAIPGFVDSHAHLVFAGDRSDEFAARMSGAAYTAGGIGATVAATRDASDDELRRRTAALVGEAMSSGTTTIECKSGYGLNAVDEVRSLRIAQEFTDETTFLGAHVVPTEFADRPDDYIDLVTGAMLDACAPHAKWIDVFCDEGAFDGDQSRAVLAAGIAAGLGARIHAGQLAPGPGAALAVDLDAASADHLTHLTDADVEALASSTTVATLLPTAEFSTRSPYPDARRLLDAGATVALAADCNPGSSYTTNIPLCIALAVHEMRMTPDEALWSATAGGAAALRRQDVGNLSPGSSGDVVLLDAPTFVHLAYRPGVPLVSAVWRGGDRMR